MSFKINDTTVIDNSRNVPSTAVGVTGLTNFTVPNGSTAQRPIGATGKIFYDTTINQLLIHDGTQWNAAHETTIGDEIFDVRSYTGSGASTQTISTGDVDLTKGGLIITKRYNGNSSGTLNPLHSAGAWWTDTKRGISSL